MLIDFSGETLPLRLEQTISSVPSSTTFSFGGSYDTVSTTAWSGTVARVSDFAYKHAVAMSDDGNRVVVGDSLAPVSGKGTGRVYIYDKSGASWNETVITNPASQNGFGVSVDISGDGNTILITHNQANKLGAWIYTLDNGSWIKESNASASGATDATLLPATILTSSGFGENSAQLSEDGNTALVAAASESFNASANYGAGYVFTRSNGIWTQAARLVGDDFATYRSSGVVQYMGEWGSSLSPDGSVVALGARGDSARKGAVYIFGNSNGSWSQLQKIANPTDTSNEAFGEAVALSESGNDLIVGAPALTSNSVSQHGIAYHYVRDGSTWTLQNTIEPQTKIATTNFAARTGQISITADGSWLMIGNGWIGATYRPYVVVLEGQP
jgi:hypothetical protein